MEKINTISIVQIVLLFFLLWFVGVLLFYPQDGREHRELITVIKSSSMSIILLLGIIALELRKKD